MPSPLDLLQAERPESVEAARSLIDRAISQKIDYYSSPISWRDEVLYFLLPDRFSDGNEASRPHLTREEVIELRRVPSRPDWNWKQWADSGKQWQGGTINGIRSKLSYLKNLGITAIWIGPIFKQRARLDTYHGYGIQDFLDVDARFGTRRDLIELVSEAHSQNIRIILDIIVNHSGDNWGYVPPNSQLDQARNEPSFQHWPNFYGAPNNSEIKDWQFAWRNETQTGFTTQASAL